MVLTDDVATGLALLTWANTYKKSQGELDWKYYVYKCMKSY